MAAPDAVPLVPWRRADCFLRSPSSGLSWLSFTSTERANEHNNNKKDFPCERLEFEFRELTDETVLQSGEGKNVGLPGNKRTSPLFPSSLNGTA